MADKAMDVYLNDHLAGATLGTDLAEQIQSRNAGTPLGELMETLAPQIQEDREALVSLMAQLGTTRNPVKQASAWVTEKATRAKFAGITSGQPELGTFMALESLTLGVKGKLGLWRTLAEVSDQHPAIASAGLKELIDRARAQYKLLERERLRAGALVFSHVHVGA
jgi:hypothetical protein